MKHSRLEEIHKKWQQRDESDRQERDERCERSADGGARCESQAVFFFEHRVDPLPFIGSDDVHHPLQIRPLKTLGREDLADLFPFPVGGQSNVRCSILRALASS